MGADPAADCRAQRAAEAQGGQLTRAQLEGAGLSPDAIRSRAARGHPRRTGRGVYAVGLATLAPRAAERAALLELGEATVLSHRSAAFLWGLIDAPPPEVHVTVAGRDIRSRDRLIVHRTRYLAPADRTLLHGLAITTPARTLLDLAADATPDELARALDEARARKLVDDRALRAAIARAPTRKGAAALRALLDDNGGPSFSRSEAERRLRKVMFEASLPMPQTNVRLRGFEVDALWPDEQLVVEVDGYAFHRGRRSFERDRAKDQALAAAGYRVLRVTWRQLTERPIAVASAIASALGEARR